MASLHKYPPFVQLLILLGIYLVFTFSFYLVILKFILPGWYGISAAALAGSDFSDPRLIHVMKLFQFAYSIFSFLIPALIFFLLWHRQPFRYAGLRSRIHWGWALAGILILFASLPAVGWLSDINKLIPFGPTIRAMQERAIKVTQAMLKMSDGNSLAFDLLLMAIIPAIAEEFFFRGVLQRLFISITKHVWIGIAITAIVFSLFHGEMLGFFPRVALGLVLGYVYYFSGNLWYPVFIHFVNNGFQVVLVFLFQHHYINTDITQEHPTPAVSGIISILLVIGLLYAYQKWVPENPDKKLWKWSDEK